MSYERKAEQQPIENEEQVFPWIGVEDYEGIDWTEYSDEELDEFGRFLMQRKGFLNGVHEGVIGERVERAKQQRVEHETQQRAIRAQRQQVIADYWRQTERWI